MSARRRRGRGSRSSPEGLESGSVTVELALGFIAVAAMIALVLAVSSIGIARQGLCRAAGEAARAAVAGVSDPDAVGARALGDLGARGATVTTSREGRWARSRARLPGRGLGGFEIGSASCEASALLGSTIP